MTGDFMQTYFSPLGKEYCDYFLFLSVLNFLLMVYVIIMAIYIAIFDKKKDGLTAYAISGISLFVNYMVTRLLYGMCRGSL